MCGRYVSPDRAAIERAWQIVRSDGNPFATRYNVQPTTSVPVLVLDSGGLARERPVPGDFVHYAVRKLVDNAKNEGAEPIEPDTDA